MSKKIFDTSVLIRQWKRRAGKSSREDTLNDARGWAQELIELYNTNCIVTPVQIDIIAGVKSAAELALARAFLSPFENIDRGEISKSDWQEALKIAQRVPLSRKPRHLGDCLIRAIAKRFNADVISFDKQFGAHRPTPSL